MMRKLLALWVNPKDNVATVFGDNVLDGTEIEVWDSKGNATKVTVIRNIPYGHKIALKSLSAGAPIVKYGEVIGVASCDIQCGEYVHIHNLDAIRGRGDLSAQKGASE